MKYLVILTIIYSSSVFSFNARLDLVQKNCIDGRYWQDEQHKINSTDDESYVYPTQEETRRYSRILKSKNNWRWLKDKLRKVIVVNPVLHGVPVNMYSKGELISSTLDGMIAGVLSEQKTNHFQRSCFFKCISSNIIRYGREHLDNNKMWNGNQRKFSEREIYEDGFGVCVEFSQIFKSIANRYGVDADIVISSSPEKSTSHAFNQVTIEKKKYYLEPQLSSCKFIKPNK